MKIITTILLFLAINSFSQDREELYQDAFKQLTEMLEDKQDINFKKAVFLVENAYLVGELDTIFVNKQIQFLKNLSLSVLKSRTLEYQERDIQEVNKYASLFSVIKDTIPMINQKGEEFIHLPFTYDFDDSFGHSNWNKMLVSKLLETKKGNCHSLPYLYKILAEEIGTTAHLSLAPNHFYIKHRSLKNGWYNTELTSGIFPIDAWLMASGYIHLKAIQNGVFMKALTQKESIALCLVDLAQGYQKAEFYDIDFVIKCADKAIEHFPKYVNAMILKAEAKGKKIENYLLTYNKDFSNVNEFPTTRELFLEIQSELTTIHELGYRQMPEDMYLNWLVSLQKEKNKYTNKKINTFTKPN
jgi:hypothetical protein